MPGLLSCFCNVIFAERRKEEDYDEEVEEDLQDEVQLHLDWFLFRMVECHVQESEYPS